MNYQQFMNNRRRENFSNASNSPTNRPSTNYSVPNNFNQTPLNQVPVGVLERRYVAPTWSQNTNDQFDDRTNILVAHGTEGNQQLSLLVEPTIKYDYEDKYFFCCSRDRDITIYPNPAQFRIKFDTQSIVEYRNVEEIQLLDCFLPDQGSPSHVSTYPYILLQINEIQETLQSSNNISNQSFTILQISGANGNWINIDEKTHRQLIKTYNPPLAKLSSLTLTLYTPNGSVLSLGTDSGSINENIQTAFVFRIRCRVKDRGELQNRVEF